MTAARERGHVLPGELVRLFQVGAPPSVLDVRSAREFDRGHIPGAVNVPFQEIGGSLDRVPQSDDRPLVVYCARGVRAWWARRTLRRHGIDDVVLLKGHWPAWRKAGLPVQTTGDHEGD